MTIETFINNDYGFLKWINDNPNGYFINTRKRPSHNYMVLHHVSCGYFKSNELPNNHKYTGNDYIKICSNDINKLNLFVKSYNGDEFSNICSSCIPQVDNYQSTESRKAEDYDQVFQAQVNVEVAHNSHIKSTIKTTPPERIETISYVVKRDPMVVAEALHLAGDICEKCDQKAPFKRSSDGSPYLEVHHLHPLSEGGLDNIDNAVALCPNCHRALHYSINREQLREELYKSKSRLKRTI